MSGTAPSATAAVDGIAFERDRTPTAAAAIWIDLVDRGAALAAAPRSMPGWRRARRCRWPAARWRSRTTSTWPACPPPPGAPPSPTSRRRSAPVVRALVDGRRRRDRHDQPRPVRHRPGRHPVALRRVPQRALGRADLRRLELRLRRGRGRRHGRPRARHRHRRLRPRPRRRATASSGSSPPAARISTAGRGARPARSLDCVSVFARTVDLAATAVGRGGRRPTTTTRGAAPAPRRTPGDRRRAVRVGVPHADGARLRRRPGRSGPLRAPRWTAVARCHRRRGGRRATSTPFLAAGRLLYDGAFVAERYAAVGDFVDAHPDDVDPVVGAIIAAAGRLPAWRFAADLTTLQTHRARARQGVRAPSTCWWCRRCPASRPSPRCRPTRSA